MTSINVLYKEERNLTDGQNKLNKCNGITGPLMRILNIVKHVLLLILAY